MRVLIDGHDSEGSLVLADNQLATVIVRLGSETHAPEHAGQWTWKLGSAKATSGMRPCSRHQKMPEPGLNGGYRERLYKAQQPIYGMTNQQSFLGRQGSFQELCRSGATGLRLRTAA